MYVTLWLLQMYWQSENYQGREICCVTTTLFIDLSPNGSTLILMCISRCSVHSIFLMDIHRLKCKCRTTHIPFFQCRTSLFHASPNSTFLSLALAFSAPICRENKFRLMLSLVKKLSFITHFLASSVQFFYNTTVIPSLLDNIIRTMSYLRISLYFFTSLYCMVICLSIFMWYEQYLRRRIRARLDPLHI
jgi:hypothetical protein